MANKRIKDLSTTAAVTASDDFIAVDGATNGTRKLDAYSPTFGGNLTVSGTGTIAGVQAYRSSGTTQQLRIGYDNNNYWDLSRDNASTGNLVLRSSNVGAGATALLTFSNSTGDATLAGNLTVSGTGTSTFAGAVTATGNGSFGSASGNGPRLKITGDRGINASAISQQFIDVATNANSRNWELGASIVNYGQFNLRYSSVKDGAPDTTALSFFNNGNVIIGTGSVDGGQKLQVNGQLKAGSATSYCLINNDGTAQLYAESSGTAQLTLTSGGAYDWRIRGGSTTMTLRRDSTDMLTFDTSSNATFAGSIAINNTVQTAVGVASTHKVTISIGGSTYYLLATNV